MSNVIQLRDELRAGERPPMAVLVDPAELQRLEQMGRDLSRPVQELARELAYLRGVEREATAAMAKVDEHRYKGFENIKVGAFARLGKALEVRP